jgi:hypothetical protein
MHFMYIFHVYISCSYFSGMGRAPATAVAYMAWIRGIPVDTAYEMMTTVRRCSPKIQAIRQDISPPLNPHFSFHSFFIRESIISLSTEVHELFFKESCTALVFMYSPWSHSCYTMCRSATADLLLGTGPVTASIAVYRPGTANSIQVTEHASTSCM